MKEFFEHDLVPCTREAVPSLQPLPDLTSNLDTAQAIVSEIQVFFNFDPRWPVFNGRARKAEEPDGPNPLLYVQILKNGQPYRSFAFRGLGFVGVVHVEKNKKYNGPSSYVDYIGAMFDGLNEFARVFPKDIDEEVMGLVEDGNLTVTIPCKH